MAAGLDCKQGKEFLLLNLDDELKKRSDVAFPREIFQQLREELDQIGYCLIEDSPEQIPGAKTLLFAFKESDLSENRPQLIVALLEKENTPESRSEALLKPLVSFIFDPEDLFSLQTILVKKIVENLRSQYVCHIRIQSNPDGAHIKSSSGLDAVSPVEWIQPIGKITVSATKEGYEPISKSLDLAEPGLHTFYLQLRKPQFYNSNFIYPTIAAGLSSILFYTLEQHYYGRYQKLGREEYLNSPEKFGNYFNTAKTFEYLTMSSLLVAGVSLGLSFKY